MKIKSINVINGKNKWSESKDKLIHMVLDLGVYENKPSDKIEGFYERIKEYLPSLKSHRCSEGKPGGFLKRIKDGTWMGHIIEHVALELQTLAGMNTGWGRTRGVKGQKGVYNVVFNYENEDSGKLAAREAFNVVNDIINDRDPKIDRIVKKLKPKNLQEHIRRILREETNPFKVSDPSTRIEEDRVQIRLGRNKENHFGKVQNIIISVDGEDITSENDVPDLGQMNIVINDGEIYVGNIVIPEKYRGQGIATIVYQKISDYFGLPIVNSKTKGRNQLDQGGQIWKNREKFEPRNLQEQIRKVLREESISVDIKTVQYDLINMIGPSKIKIVNTIGSFNSSFKIIVDHLDQEILDKINNYMNENGWFPHSIGLSDMKERRYSQNVKNYIGEDDVQIGYESNTPEGINTTQTKAFHVTPDIFLDKIMETGLTLKSEGKLSDHPSRIYLFLNGDKNTQKGIVWAIWNSLSKERQETIKNYYVLEIDLTQIPNHKIYRDPQAFITYEAVYVNQPIPKSAIKVIDRIDTSNIETENDIDMTKEEEKIARDEKKRKEEESIEQQKKSDLTYDQFKKSVNKLPDNLKNMNIDDLMNLQEHIRRILREESGLNPRFLRKVPNHI